MVCHMAPHKHINRLQLQIASALIRNRPREQHADPPPTRRTRWMQLPMNTLVTSHMFYVG